MILKYNTKNYLSNTAKPFQDMFHRFLFQHFKMISILRILNIEGTKDSLNKYKPSLFGNISIDTKFHIGNNDRKNMKQYLNHSIIH